MLLLLLLLLLLVVVVVVVVMVMVMFVIWFSLPFRTKINFLMNSFLGPVFIRSEGQWPQISDTGSRRRSERSGKTCEPHQRVGKEIHRKGSEFLQKNLPWTSQSLAITWLQRHKLIEYIITRNTIFAITREARVRGKHWVEHQRARRVVFERSILAEQRRETNQLWG